MTEENDRIFDCMAQMVGDNQPFALGDRGSHPERHLGESGRQGGDPGGCLGRGAGSAAVACAGAVLKAAAKALADGRPRLIRVGPDGEVEDADDVDTFTSHCPSGGTAEIFVEPMLPRPALLVMGASPTAQAVADVGVAAGFAVTVAAPEADLAAFGEACTRIAGYDVADSPRAAESFVVVATQGRGDRKALEGAIATGSAYVAFVGSRRKSAKLRADLTAAGVDPERVGAVRGPAGLDIGAATPGEIALAVLADVVRERRQGGVMAAEDGQGDVAAIDSGQIADPH